MQVENGRFMALWRISVLSVMTNLQYGGFQLKEESAKGEKPLPEPNTTLGKLTVAYMYRPQRMLF